MDLAVGPMWPFTGSGTSTSLSFIIRKTEIRYVVWKTRYAEAPSTVPERSMQRGADRPGEDAVMGRDVTSPPCEGGRPQQHSLAATKLDL